MKNRILVIALIICPLFSNAQDSLDNQIRNLETKIEKVEGFQENTRDSLNNEFDSLSNKLQDDYNLMKWLMIIGLPVSILLLIGGIWKNRKYLDEKLNKKFDKIIEQNESDILEVINKHSIENQILKNKKILVISDKDGDDSFLKKFFKEMKFDRNNVKYVKTNTYGNHHGDYDVVFANNEKDDLNIDLIDDYFNNSNDKAVVFYYNTTRKNYTNNDVSDRLSFANSRTQIYGNLINLLKYQVILD
jgi:hypothetical protein